jgi:hypothetical protein
MDVLTHPDAEGLMDQVTYGTSEEIEQAIGILCDLMEEIGDSRLQMFREVQSKYKPSRSQMIEDFDYYWYRKTTEKNSRRADAGGRATIARNVFINLRRGVYEYHDDYYDYWDMDSPTREEGWEIRGYDNLFITYLDLAEAMIKAK